MGKLNMKNLLILIASTFLFISCEGNNDAIILQNESVVINSILYKEATTNNYTISNVNLLGNLLTVKISSSGCNSASWQASLIGTNEVLESFPVQRNVILSLENKEACLAVFEKEFTFDISILKENYSEIILNLDGWDTQINYE